MRNQMDPDDAIAEAKIERERINELNEEGLCIDCGSAPQNPHIAGDVCLDCYKGRDGIGCMTSGCPNSTHGSFGQGAYCKAHLADKVHKAYHKYLGQKQELEVFKEEFDKRVEEFGEHPRSFEGPPSNWSDEKEMLYDTFTGLKRQADNVNSLKREIRRAISQNEDLFPDNFTLFG